MELVSTNKYFIIFLCRCQENFLWSGQSHLIASRVEWRDNYITTLCSEAAIAISDHFVDLEDPKIDRTKLHQFLDAIIVAAMFSLKDPSLLAFDERRTTGSNRGSIYGIKEVTGDTQMRTILDDVDPREISPAFRAVVRQLQRTKELDRFVFLGGSYLFTVSLPPGSSYSMLFEPCLVDNLSSCAQTPLLLVQTNTPAQAQFVRLVPGISPTLSHPNQAP